MEQLRSGWVLGALLGWAGCTGGQTGESPGEPAALYKGGDGRCEARACAGPKPSAEQLSQFGANVRGPIGDYEIYDTVAEAIAGPTLIATGWLVGVEAGRREADGLFCVIPEGTPESEQATAPCLGWEQSYSSHVNLVIEAEAVLRGEVPAPAQHLRVELHWPNNLPIDKLVAWAPLGARVLVLSKWITNAHERAAPLAEAGIDTGNIAENLLAALPYGMALEDAEGFTVRQLFYGEHLALLIDPSGGAVRFDDLVSAISAALE